MEDNRGFEEMKDSAGSFQNCHSFVLWVENVRVRDPVRKIRRLSLYNELQSLKFKQQKSTACKAFTEPGHLLDWKALFKSVAIIQEWNCYSALKLKPWQSDSVWLLTRQSLLTRVKLRHISSCSTWTSMTFSERASERALESRRSKHKSFGCERKLRTIFAAALSVSGNVRFFLFRRAVISCNSNVEEQLPSTWVAWENEFRELLWQLIKDLGVR